jgi:hypothetical protein
MKRLRRTRRLVGRVVLGHDWALIAELSLPVVVLGVILFRL